MPPSSKESLGRLGAQICCDMFLATAPDQHVLKTILNGSQKTVWLGHGQSCDSQDDEGQRSLGKHGAKWNASVCLIFCFLLDVDDTVRWERRQ